MLKHGPLVSVIMPAFNEECSLGYAIDSVKRQSYTSWELIVIDDASTDFTSVICDHYASTCASIRVVRNEVNSRSGTIRWEARNDGLKLARETSLPIWTPTTHGIPTISPRWLLRSSTTRS